MRDSFSFSLLVLVLGVATVAAGQSGSGGQNIPVPVAQAEARTLDRGTLAGVDYVNDFFGLSLSVPSTWVVVSAERRDAVVGESRKMLSGDEARKAKIDDSIQRSVVLLSLTKLPAGQPGNASFMLIAERLPLQVKTSSDVIRLMEGTMKGTNFNVEFQGEVRTEQIGDSEFASVTLKNDSPHGTFMQKIYVTTKNGYALELFFTYLDDANLPAFDSIMKTVRIK
jgi:hypothetical protein